MTSSTKRRLAWRLGAVLAAAAASGTLGISAASADSGVMPSAGITVPGDTAGAPAVPVAVLVVAGGQQAGRVVARLAAQHGEQGCDSAGAITEARHRR